MPGVAAPPVILEGFGSGAGASYITNPIPVLSQQPNPRASYTDGFPPQTVGATGTPPDVRDVNGIFFAVSQNIAALLAGQYHEFDSNISTQNSGYAQGAIVPAADLSGWWLNRTSGNTNNPDTTAAASSGWAPMAQYGATAITGLTNANVTLTGPQAAKEIITLAGTLTGNVQIIFPTWNEQWLIVNNTTGAFSVTCKTAAGSGVVCAQGLTTLVYGDGTNIVVVGSGLSASTAATPSTLAERDSNGYLWATQFKVSSDERLKTGIGVIHGALQRVGLLRGVTYRFTQGGPKSAGIIAQDLVKAIPEGVCRDSAGHLSVDPMAVIALLVEAVKQLSMKVEALER